MVCPCPLNFQLFILLTCLLTAAPSSSQLIVATATKVFAVQPDEDSSVSLLDSQLWSTAVAGGVTAIAVDWERRTLAVIAQDANTNTTRVLLLHTDSGLRLAETTLQDTAVELAPVLLHDVLVLASGASLIVVRGIRSSVEIASSRVALPFRVTRALSADVVGNTVAATNGRDIRLVNLLDDDVVLSSRVADFVDARVSNASAHVFYVGSNTIAIAHAGAEPGSGTSAGAASANITQQWWLSTHSVYFGEITRVSSRALGTETVLASPSFARSSSRLLAVFDRGQAYMTPTCAEWQSLAIEIVNNHKIRTSVLAETAPSDLSTARYVLYVDESRILTATTSTTRNYVVPYLMPGSTYTVALFAMSPTFKVSFIDVLTVSMPADPVQPLNGTAYVDIVATIGGVTRLGVNEQTQLAFYSCSSLSSISEDACYVRNVTMLLNSVTFALRAHVNLFVKDSVAGGLDARYRRGIIFDSLKTFAATQDHSVWTSATSLTALGSASIMINPSDKEPEPTESETESDNNMSLIILILCIVLSIALSFLFFLCLKRRQARIDREKEEAMMSMELDGNGTLCYLCIVLLSACFLLLHSYFPFHFLFYSPLFELLSLLAFHVYMCSSCACSYHVQ